MAQQQSTQEVPEGLKIQFEVSLVPADEDVQGYIQQGYAPVYSSPTSGNLARVQLGARDYNIVMGKTLLVGGQLRAQ